MLNLEGVSKVYQVGTFGGKELRAVSDVTFGIGKGEIVSLIGESGSGKSTIGKMILRLIPRSKGTITFKGKDISSYKGRQKKEYYRQVQGVFQDPFSSYNPVFKADRVFKIAKDQFFPDESEQAWQSKVEEALLAVGLNPEHCLNKFPHQLSGGQLQRLLIARALLLDVDFLVADEIISMLDASTRIDVLNLLADLKSRGLSILFITHDLSLGYYVSERAVILHRGVVVEMGETDRIYGNPMHPYTKMLMASVPRLDKKWEDVAIEAGIEPAKAMLPTGWTFYEHQPLTSSNGAEGPTLLEVEEGHLVACCPE
jgi:peptide/nickel transport system ATP-binding protein